MFTLTRVTGAALTAAILAVGALGAGAGTAVAAPAAATGHTVSRHAAQHASRGTTGHSSRHSTVKHGAKGMGTATGTGATAARRAVPAAAIANLTPFELALLGDMNATRAAAGLPALVAAPGATDVARRWSLQLAQSNGLSHNPSLAGQLEAAGSNAWTAIEENVGTAPADDEKGLFAAYLASPHHRENILDPSAKFVGVGAIQVIAANGLPTAWNTVDFVDAYTPGYGSDRAPALASVLPLAQAAQAF